MKKAIFIFCAVFAVSLFAEEVKLHVLKSFPMNLNVSADTYEGNFVYAVGFFIKNCSCPEGDEVRNKYKLKRYSTIDHLSKKQLMEKYPDVIKFIQDEFDVGVPTLEKEMVIQKTVQIKMLRLKLEIPAYSCLWHAMVLAERGSVTAQLALLYQKGSYLTPTQRRNIAKELFNAGYMEAYVAMGRYYELRKNKEKAQEYFVKALEYFVEVAPVYYTAEQKKLIFECCKAWLDECQSFSKYWEMKTEIRREDMLYLKKAKLFIDKKINLPNFPEVPKMIISLQMVCFFRFLEPLVEDVYVPVSQKEYEERCNNWKRSFDLLVKLYRSVKN
mgnify:CR=1 FL=1